MVHRCNVLHTYGIDMLGNDFYIGIKGVQTFAQKGKFFHLFNYYYYYYYYYYVT